MVIELVQHDPRWSQQFEAEAQKLLLALGGSAWDGGEVYLLEHVGSTSIPGIVAKPCIDILVGVYPFPLEDKFIGSLENLGYTYRGRHGIPGRQYFQRGPHDYHVHVYDISNEAIHDCTVFRDYLRVHDQALKRYETLKLELAQTADSRTAYTDGKTSLVQMLLQEAHAWHLQKTSFKPVEFLAKELPVAGGWICF
jgi:GrpB-like predicted nucleotidyltransferase (UPF0157 family)